VIELLLESLAKEDALMALPCVPARVTASRHFDARVGRIQDSQFRVKTPAEASIGKGCNLQPSCTAKGVLARAQV